MANSPSQIQSEPFHPLCKECRGACCSSWPIPIDHDPHLSELLEPRTLGSANGLRFLNCQCSHLSPEGTCSIYHARPQLCRTFTPNGPDCRATLKALRPAIYQKLQPLPLHPQ